MCDRENDPDAPCKQFSVIKRKVVPTTQEKSISAGKCIEARVRGVYVIMEKSRYTEITTNKVVRK
jgi:hypothetical protein